MIEKLMKLQRNKFINSACNLLYPEHCVICKRIGNWICEDCIEKNATFSQLCFYCREGSLGGRTHPKCQDKTSISKLVSFYQYNNITKQLLKELKFRHGYILVDKIVGLIKQRLKFFKIETNTAITAVPLHPERERWRGFNQAELIAKEISKILDIQYITLAKRVKNTKPQSSIKFNNRHENMENAFELIEKNITELPFSVTIVFDDVITSGATIEMFQNNKTITILTLLPCVSLCPYRPKQKYYFGKKL